MCPNLYHMIMLKSYLSTDARPVFSLVLSRGAMVPFNNQTEIIIITFIYIILGEANQGSFFIKCSATAVQSG